MASPATQAITNTTAQRRARRAKAGPGNAARPRVESATARHACAITSAAAPRITHQVGRGTYTDQARTTSAKASNGVSPRGHSAMITTDTAESAVTGRTFPWLSRALTPATPVANAAARVNEMRWAGPGPRAFITSRAFLGCGARWRAERRPDSMRRPKGRPARPCRSERPERCRDAIG